MHDVASLAHWPLCEGACAIPKILTQSLTFPMKKFQPKIGQLVSIVGMATGCLIAAAPVGASSLCHSDEITAFTCEIGRKVLSICSTKTATGPQYRFGRPGQTPELAFPTDWPHGQPLILEKSLDWMGGVHQYEFTIDFKNGTVSYQVAIMEQGRYDASFASGVVIAGKGLKRTELTCRHVTERPNFEELERLAVPSEP